MLGIIKRRQARQDELEAQLRAEEGDKARHVTASVEDLLKYLDVKYPDSIPVSEISQWEMGVLKGRQDVLRDIRHLVEASHY